MSSSINTMTSEESFNPEQDKYIETPWSIIESYFKGQHLQRLVRHQLESYNNFVGYQINKTIEMLANCKPKSYASLSNKSIFKFMDLIEA